jgi:hypothetical protein
VDEAYDPSFLTVLARYVERMGPGFTVIRETLTPVVVK